ncbi:MAG: hypothetical protein ACE3JP_13755 [Ectobacillus sp.]
MGQQVDLTSLISKLIREYEQTYGEMVFAFQKINGKFIYTYINDRLLKAAHLQEQDVMGKGLDNLNIGSALAAKLQQIYTKAWGGQEAVYYFIPDTNPEILLVIALKPQFEDSQVTEVRGHCAPLRIDEFQYATELLSSFKPFDSISD